MIISKNDKIGGSWRKKLLQFLSLKNAFNTILEAVEIDKKDKYIGNLYRTICKDLGITLSKLEGFGQGRPYLV
jgi:hypothetical protein